MTTYLYLPITNACHLSTHSKTKKRGTISLQPAKPIHSKLIDSARDPMTKSPRRERPSPLVPYESVERARDGLGLSTIARLQAKRLGYKPVLVRVFLDTACSPIQRHPNKCFLESARSVRTASL